MLIKTTQVCWRECEATDLSNIAGWIAKWYSYFGKQFGIYIFIQLNVQLSYEPDILPIGISSKSMKTGLDNKLYINVHSHFMHNSPKQETTQLCIYW